MLSLLTKRASRSQGAKVSAAKAPKRAFPKIEGLENRAFFSLSTTLQADFSLIQDFGVLGLSGCKIDITNPKTQIGSTANPGDVGIGPGGTQNFSEGYISGKLVVDPTANNTKSNNVKTGFATVTRNLQPAVNAALEISSLIGGMSPTQAVIPSITGSKTLFSTTHINVVKTGSISLSGSSALTLKAAFNDYFFINVTGKYAMSGTSRINLTGGITTQHVVFNILGTGEAVAFTGGSVGVGTYFANNRDISVSGATVNGVLIGAMNHKIALTSGAQIQVDTPHFDALDLGQE